MRFLTYLQKTPHPSALLPPSPSRGEGRITLKQSPASLHILEPVRETMVRAGFAIMNHTMTNIIRHNPPSLFDSSASGFSQISVKETKSVKIISVSGQVAWDENRKVVGPNNLNLQVITSLRNLEKALVSVGAGLTDVMSLRIYIIESHISDSLAVTKALIEIFGDELPCTTWIGVPALASKEFLVEIEPDPIIILNS